MAYFYLPIVCLFSFGCFAQNPLSDGNDFSKKQENLISNTDLIKHIKILASDEYEGRAPGTKGEELTVKYISDQFTKLGLQPGNPDGTYFQDVPLYGYKSSSTSSVSIDGNNFSLAFPRNYVAVSRSKQNVETIKNSEIIFVGYGIQAPEYNWDDYKGIDVKGKTILMLINDPPIPDPRDSTKLDSTIFNGRAMTYYGRWTYKYEIASKLGAAAAIIIHETGPAGYPFDVVTGSWGRENFDIDSKMEGTSQVAVESWISDSIAKVILQKSGMDFYQLKKSANSKNFKPVALAARINFTVNNSIRKVNSKNVIAKKSGTHPERKNEYIVYTAHWDHLGKDSSLKGDQIYNGAIDNASGVAGVLELAKAFAKTNTERTILFLAVTAEEVGLLGSKFYNENPLYPLSKTLANINMDGLNPWGKTRDIIIVGKGQSNLDDMLTAAAKTQNKKTVAEDTPEKGSYYRSDHFEFAKKGVPSIYTRSGIQFIGKPDNTGKNLIENYIKNDYHKVSDEFKQGWTFEGGVDDLKLFYQVGLQVSNGSIAPAWNSKSEFKTIRENSLK